MEKPISIRVVKSPVDKRVHLVKLGNRILLAGNIPAKQRAKAIRNVAKRRYKNLIKQGYSKNRAIQLTNKYVKKLN